jgi:endo-1,4-beta-xylanase
MRYAIVISMAGLLIPAMSQAQPVSGPTAKPSHTSVIDEAKKGIEQYRKGDITLMFRLPDGSNLGNAKVEVEQVSHDFPFGNYIRPRHYQDATYLNRFKELFNFIQFLEFNWGQYEPDEGTPHLASRIDFLRNWCLPNGYQHFYGHMLVWTADQKEPEGSQVPEWLFRYEKATQYELLKKRIQRDVAAYKDFDIVWDVVNEAVHCRVWGDWDKIGYIQNKQAEPLERIVPYVKDAIAWAHEANPNAPLLINDYTVIVTGRFQRQYKGLIDALQSQKVPLSAIGIQAHEPNKGKYWYSPEELWAAYDLLGRQTGLPIYITEFFNVSDDTKPIYGSYRKGNWSEALHADAVEEFYRISFGHPSIKVIMYFGMSDNDAVIPKCALLDKQYRPKPAWERLKQLIWHEWITKVTANTTADGRVAFRGFYGNYKVRLSYGDREQSFEFHAESSKPNAFEFKAHATTANAQKAGTN